MITLVKLFSKGFVGTNLVIIYFLGLCWGNIEITEIFVDGTQEYIEFQNNGSEIFSGKLIINGIKSQSLEVIIDQEIVPGKYFILADSAEQIDEESCPIYSQQGISFIDSSSVNIAIEWSGGNVETFIDSEVVIGIDNQKRSLIYDGEQYRPVHDEESKNTIAAFLGTPCFGQDFLNEESQYLGSGTIADDEQENIVDETLIGSGNTTGTGGQSTHDDSMNSEETGTESYPQDHDEVSSIDTDTGETEHACSWSQQLHPGDISIQAISPKNGTFSDEFIILYSTSSFSGTLFIGGGGRGASPLEVDIQVFPNQSVLIAKNLEGFTSHIPLIENSSLSLSDAGETLLIYQDPSVLLDQATWSSSQKDSMIFSQTLADGAERDFSLLGMYPELFTLLNDLSCSLTQYDNTLKVSDSSICSLPGEFFRKSNDTIYTNNCIGGIDIGTGTYSFEYRINDTVVCSSNFSKYTSIDTDETILSGSYNEIENFTISITEISPKNDRFPEYIELVHINGKGNLFEIQGAGRGTGSIEFLIHSDISPFIITQKLNENLSLSQQIIIPGLSLLDSGEELTLRHGGQEIDTLVYSGNISKDMAWHNTSGSLIQEIVTPGFNKNQIEYLLPDENEFKQCGINIQNTASFTVSNKINLIASYEKKDITNSNNSIRCERGFGGLLYDTNEIEEMRCNPGYLYGEEPGLYTTTLTLYDNGGNEICKTFSVINLPEEPASSGSSGGKGDYYQGLYQKRKGRFESLKKAIKPYGLTSNASGSVVTQIGFETDSLAGSFQSGTGTHLSIVRVLPNPAGKDEGNERLVLRNSSQDDFSLQGRYLHNGKSKKKLDAVIIEGNSTYEYIGTLGLVNANRCVRIMNEQEVVYDTFCYGKAGDDQWFSESNQAVASLTSSSDTLNLQDLQLTIGDVQVCLQYQDSSLSCKDLPIDKESLKMLKLDAKKTTSLQKKYDKELERRKKYQQELKDQKTKNTQTKKDYQNKLKNEKEKSSDYYGQVQFEKRRTNLLNSLVYQWHEILTRDYSVLYYNSVFEDAWKAYQLSKASLYQNEGVKIGPVTISSASVETITAYFGGTSIMYQVNEKPSSILSQINMNVSAYLTDAQLVSK